MNNRKAVGVLGLGVAGVGLAMALTKKGKPPPPPPGLANLYGKVTDAITGKAIPDVLVTLDAIQTLTDSSGNYRLVNLEPGGYLVEFSKEGYETKIF